MLVNQSIVGEPERRGGERSEAPRSGGSPTIERDVAPGPPDPEVPAKPQRRRFTAEYRLRILKEADACKQPGELGALLRREGLYSSHLTNWRRQREEGALRDLRARRRGPAPRPIDPRVKQLEAENRRLQRKLQRAETIITLQKNHRARRGPRSLLDQKLPVRLSSRDPGRSGRLLIGDAANP
jgi:transposase-like protein